MNSNSSDEPTPSTHHAAEETNHPDPITGEAGAHPVGVGVGAIGAGLAGAAIGAIAGPVGVLVGAAIGAVAGGLAGKEVAAADDEPVSLADQPLSGPGTADPVYPAESLAGLNAGGMPGSVLPSAAIMSTPPAGVEATAGQFHDAFTTTTWQEAAAEDQAGGDNEGELATDRSPRIAAVPVGRKGFSSESAAWEKESSEGTVRIAAYYRYLHRQATGETGDALGDWVRAEQEVLAR